MQGKQSWEFDDALNNENNEQIKTMEAKKTKNAIESIDWLIKQVSLLIKWFIDEFSNIV